MPRDHPDQASFGHKFRNGADGVFWFPIPMSGEGRFFTLRLSRERVRQIEVRAFEKVPKVMKAAAKELAKPPAAIEAR
jgi:hypothetical protein